MKVKFLPGGEEYEIKPNQTVLQLAQEHGIHIKSVCKGIPSCAECRIQIAEGEYNVMPPTHTELEFIGTAYFVDHRRLACQLRCFGDITVDMTEQKDKENEVVKSKRPRGYVHKKEGEESQAVMGNIMQDDDQSVADVNERTANLTLQEEEIRRELSRVKALKGGGREDRNSSRGDRGPRNDSSARGDRSQPKGDRSSNSEDQPKHRGHDQRRRRNSKPNAQGDQSASRNSEHSAKGAGSRPQNNHQKSADSQGGAPSGADGGGSKKRRNRNRRRRKPKSGQ